LTGTGGPPSVSAVGQHVEQFRLPASLAECEEACHRALRSVDWQELPTDTLEVKAPMVYDQSDAGCLISLLEVVPAFRRRLDRVRTLTFHAPAGPPGSQAEIAASWRGGQVMVRISLRERAGFGTEMTISGSGATGVSSAVRELRRSIEIQAGSLTPYRPPS